MKQRINKNNKKLNKKYLRDHRRFLEKKKIKIKIVSTSSQFIRKALNKLKLTLQTRRNRIMFASSVGGLRQSTFISYSK